MAEEQKEEQEEQTPEAATQDETPADSAPASASDDQSSSTDDSAKKDNKDNAEEEVEVPEKFKALVEEIEKMSVLDLSELVKVLEKKFGVSAAAPAVAVAATPAGDGGEGGSAEKDSYDIELTAVGDNKIGVIKVIREITGQGLKEAKDMVEGAPVIVKEGVKKEEAEEIKKKLTEAGAQVTLK